MHYLDTSDPDRLEAQLEAAPLGTCARIEHEDGAVFHVYRTPGGWYLPGDMAVASRDVVDGEPVSVALLDDLFGEDPYDEEDGK